jgi:hypothetical protein
MVVWALIVVLVMAVVLIVQADIAVAQTDVQQSGTTVFGVGASVGMWLIPDYTLYALGAVAGVSLTPGIGIRAGFQHAGIGIFGVQLLTIDIFDVNAVFDLFPKDRFGVYFLGGGAFVLASALGTGARGVGITAGAGVRLDPIESLKIFCEYRGIVRASILHIVQAGICFSF